MLRWDDAEWVGSDYFRGPVVTVLSDCWDGDITYVNGENSERNRCIHAYL